MHCAAFRLALCAQAINTPDRIVWIVCSSLGAYHWMYSLYGLIGYLAVHIYEVDSCAFNVTT